MKRFISTALKIVVTLLLFYWIVSKYEIGKIFEADFTCLGLATLVFFLSNFLGAWQWQKLLQGLGLEFPFRRSLNLYFIGLFFNTILPGCLGGDVVKVYSVSRIEKRGREGLAATFVDRFAGFFLLALFALAGSLYLLISPLFAGQTIRHNILIYILVIFLIFLLLSVVLFSRRITHLIYEGLLANVNPLGLKDKLRDWHELFHAYRHQYRLAGEVFLLSFLIQLSRIAVHYLCALSIGFDIDFIYFLIFVPLIAVVALLPVSFGGLGVRESSAPFLFTSVAAIAAVDPEGHLAVTTQFLASLVGILVGLIGGVLFILTRTAGRKEPVSGATGPA